MVTAKETTGETRYGARIIAFFLFAGGALGMLGSTVTFYRTVHQGLPAGISGIISALLFAWCIGAAVALWRATPNGFKGAKLLFAMQVPVFSIARFSYEFFTFFSFRVMLGNTTRHIGGDVGSSSNLNLLPQSLGFLFGINIVAVLILLYLIQSSRSPRQEHDSQVELPSHRSVSTSTRPVRRGSH